MRKLKIAYRKKHGEMFIPFNYGDFQGTEDKLAAEVYIETLKKAIEMENPYRAKIVPDDD